MRQRKCPQFAGKTAPAAKTVRFTSHPIACNGRRRQCGPAASLDGSAGPHRRTRGRRHSPRADRRPVACKRPRFPACPPTQAKEGVKGRLDLKSQRRNQLLRPQPRQQMFARCLRSFHGPSLALATLVGFVASTVSAIGHLRCEGWEVNRSRLRNANGCGRSCFTSPSGRGSRGTS